MKQSKLNSKVNEVKLPVFTVQGDRTPVPDGEYTAQITEIKADRYKNIRDCIRFMFEIVEGDYAGRQLTGWANAPTEGKITRNTKLVKWYETCVGHHLGDEDEIRLETIVENVVVVRTKTNTTRFDNQFSNVVEIVRLVCEA